MAQQVKFYSVAVGDEKPTSSNGIIFVDNGELYKGTQRFGAKKVFTAVAGASNIENATEGISGQIGGDILTGFGVAKVWDAEANSGSGSWVDLGKDYDALDQQLKNLVSNLAFASDSGLYIKGITKDETSGAVTAHTSNFATDVKTAVGNSTSTSTSNGVTVSVTTSSGKVTQVSVTAPAAKTWTAVDVGGSGMYIQEVHQNAEGQVSATAVSFPSLSTGSTDGTVKLGNGQDIKVSGWETVKTDISNIQTVVSYSQSGSEVTASTGNFTNLNVTDTATFNATTVSASTLTVGGSTVEQLADKQIGAATLTGDISSSEGTKLVNEGQVVDYVSAAIQSFDNAMHYIGITETASMSQGWTGTPTITGKTYTQKKAGDIVLKGTQEYIWNGSAWEIIGDQGTYAVEAVVSASVSALQNRATALETSMATRASAGTGTATASYGVSGSVVLAANAEPTFSIAVAPVTTAAGITSTATTSLATAAAIKAYVDGAVSAAVPGTSTKGDVDKGVQVSVTTTSGVVTAVDVVTTLDTSLSANADNAPTTKAVFDALCWYKADGTTQW